MATKPRHLKTPLQLWIADNRKRLGLTPGDLAALTGVTQDTARGWESRGKPAVDALAVLERRFGQPAPTEAALPEGQSALVAEIRALREAVVAQTEAQTRSIASLGAALTAVFLQLGGQPVQSLDELAAPREGRQGGK